MLLTVSESIVFSLMAVPEADAESTAKTRKREAKKVLVYFIVV